jgi:hypothetical protein
LEFSIVIPCLNEAETIGACVQQAFEALEREGVEGEVVVADNGSTDGSQRIAGDLSARVVKVERRGYGSALQAGIAASRGRFFLFADADGSYDFEQLGLFLAKLREGYEMVIGSRFPDAGGQIEDGAMPWLHRFVGTPVIGLVGRLFYGARLSDFNCGMRAMLREAYDRLAVRTLGMEFASEMIVKATSFGVKTAEVPIRFRRAGRTRAPHLRTFRDGWRHLRFLLICSPRWLFIAPGLVLMVLGLVGGLALLPGPVRFGQIAFDTNTLLISVMMVLLGHQVTSFGVIANIFVMQSGIAPRDPRFLRLVERYDVEVGILVGVGMTLVGLALLVASLLRWQEVGFGHLSYSGSLRVVIPGVALIVLGMQTMFNGFIFQILLRTHS